MVGITIDPQDAIDLDDAFWVEKYGDDSYLVQISIASPTQLIELDSPEDLRARKLAYAQYDRARGYSSLLFPRETVINPASLTPGCPKPALTFTALLYKGQCVDYSIEEAMFSSRGRFTPSDIGIILRDKNHPLCEMLHDGIACATQLRQYREQRGSVIGISKEQTSILYEDGSLRKIGEEEIVGCMLVQEFMILANTIAAQYVHKTSAPILYRNQVRRTVNRIGQNASDQLLSLIHQHDLYDPKVITDQWVTEFGPAFYGTTSVGHAGLAVDAYTHISSPLRRYADVVNQRILIALLREEQGPYMGDDLEVMAENISLVENAIYRNAHTPPRRITTIAQDLLSRALSTSAQGKEFDELLRLAAERGRGGKGLLKTLEDRALRGEIRETQLYALLIEGRSHVREDWVEIRSWAYRQLCQQTGLARSIISLLQARLGVPLPVLLISRAGEDEDSDWIVAGQMTLDDTVYVTDSYRFSSEKAAKRAVHMDLIARIAAVPGITQEIVRGFVEQEIKRSVHAPTLINEEGLQQICERNEGWESPVYEVQQVGKRQHSTFSARVIVQTPEGRMEGPIEFSSHRTSARDRAAYAFLHKFNLQPAPCS